MAQDIIHENSSRLCGIEVHRGWNSLETQRLVAVSVILRGNGHYFGPAGGTHMIL